MTGVPACVWTISPELLVALDTQFGQPTDSYINGSQVWLRDDGPGGAGLEWRLHPVTRFVRPSSITAYDLFEVITYAVRLGDEPLVPITSLWDGLEAFPAWDDEVEPRPLAHACSQSLGLEPTAFGLVNHTPIGDQWESTLGAMSIFDAVLTQLRS